MIETRISKGRKVYRARVRLARTDKSMTFTRQQDAIDWEARTSHEACQNRYLKRKIPGMVDTSTIIDRYIAMKNPSATRLGQLKWWRERIGMVPIDRVDQSLIFEYQEKLKTEPYYRKNKPLTHSNATVNRYLAAIRVVFSYACRDWGLLSANPCSYVRKLKEPQGRLRYLSPDEIRRLFLAIDEMDHPILTVVVMLVLFTGARKMEILGLKWGDVEMSSHQLIFRHTKNGKVRWARLSDVPWELFMRYYKLQNPQSFSEFVFPSQNGKKPQCIRTAFKMALEKAGIDDFRFHDLRHTAATYIQATGANTNFIASFLGHSSPSLVPVYAHIMPGHQMEHLNKMEKTYCECIPSSAINKYLITDETIKEAV